MKIYHYTNSESVIKILISEKIKFTLIDELNDPFEFQFDAEERDHAQFDKILRKQSAVFCCSKDPNNILMLSHYANKHKGWFIEFEFNENPPNKNIAVAHVNYDRPKPDLKNLFKNLDDKHDSKKDMAPTKEETELIMQIVTTKDSHWAYEKETRFLLSKVGDELDHDNLFLTIQECGLAIKAVHKGCRVSKQDGEIVEKIIKTKNQNIEII